MRTSLISKLRTIACAFIGHSNVLNGGFGQMHCGRCDQYLGDTLGGVYKNDRAVNVRCRPGCEFCPENAKSLTWRDRFLLPREARHAVRDYLKQGGA